MSERLFVLESSFVIYRLAPWHSNLPKRYIKSPKLYFHDTGLAVWLSGCLAAWLPGITDASQLNNHPLRGAFFENLVVSEALKHFENHGIHAPLMFFRDQTGNEIDLLIPRGAQHQAVEIKSGQTLSPTWLDRLKWFGGTFPEQNAEPALLVHPREDIQKRSKVTLLNHRDFAQHLPVK